MNCNEINEDDIYFPVVLSGTMCEKCYKEWCDFAVNYAINYPEYREYEEKMLNKYLDIINT